MADIRPFKGIRYNLQKVTSLSKVIAPPYDVITPDHQDALYSREGHNVIRLILGKDKPEDTPEENKHTRAARSFRQWLESGILAEDPGPAFYVYDQAYVTPEGVWKTRRGFFASVKIEPLDSGIIRPHEFTLPGPKADRLSLFRAAKANFSPIFGLYEDPELQVGRLLSSIHEASPDMDARDDEGVFHRLWLIRDQEISDQIRSDFQDREILIADGHHRYETALAYRDELRAASSGWSQEEPANFVLMVLVSLIDPGLAILPTHRAVDLLEPVGGGHGLMDLEELLRKVGEFFFIKELSKDTRATALSTLLSKHREQHSFGLVTASRSSLLTLRPESLKHPLLSQCSSEAFQQLDVTILHTFVIEHVLGGKDVGCKLTYVKEAKEGVLSVHSGEHQMIFLMNPTGLDEVLKVARAGEKMPQKSTYFHPKLITGFVMRKLWAE